MLKFGIKSFLVFAVLLINQIAWAKSESWYFNLGLNYPMTHWNTGWASEIGNTTNQGYKGSVIGSDVGFYFPSFGKSTVFGFSSLFFDEDYTKGTSVVSFSTLSLTTGFMCFLGGEPGDGPFLRLEVGGGGVGKVHSKFFVPPMQQMGPAVMGGGGFGIALSGETRVLIGIYGELLKLRDGNNRSLLYSLSLLF